MVQPALMLTKESSSVSRLELYARVTWILPLGKGVRMYLFPVLSAFTMTGGSSMLDWIALWAGVPPVLPSPTSMKLQTRPPSENPLNIYTSAISLSVVGCTRSIPANACSHLGIYI